MSVSSQQSDTTIRSGTDPEGAIVAAPSRMISSNHAGLDDAATLRSFVARISEAIYITNPQDEFIDGNPALLRIFGATSLEELQGYGVAELIVDADCWKQRQEQLEKEGKLRNYELQIRRLDGDISTVLDSVFCQLDDAGELSAYYGILVDITRRKQLEQKYLDLCVRDPLTGCYNRRYLDRMRPHLERPTAAWGCLMLDIDNFKSLHDDYGHEEGDRVLQGLVHFIQRHGRVEDWMVRLGGDEFALLAPTSSRETLEKVARRMLEMAPKEAPAAFSLGIAFRRPGETIERVLARADRAMYEAKRGGARALQDAQPLQQGRSRWSGRSA